MHEDTTTDVLIIGGGLGGVAATLAALKLEKRVILTEETDWIGGQLTAQAVPPDEHPWIESTGCTASYRRLREGIRNYYRDHYPLRDAASEQVHLNPGEGQVSRLCHEPRVALAVIEAMLAPYRSNKQLTVRLNTRLAGVEQQGDRITAVIVVDQDGDQTTIAAPYILDATELGDLLAMAKIEHVMGSESQAQTSEMHALPDAPDPSDQQAISWCYAIDYLPGEDHVIEKPEDYDFWRGYQAAFWPGPQLGWVDVYPWTLEPRTRAIFHAGDLSSGRDQSTYWLYRRIFNKDHYAQGRYASDITLVNWPQIDYWLGPIVGVPEAEMQKHLRSTQQLSLSMLYWMQTEAPRHDKGFGYPGLRLREDVVGTKSGLAKYVYVREARRIQAELTVTEAHVGVLQRQGLTCAQFFQDSVGVGAYRIDLHPSTGLRSYIDISSYPYQIPLGALIPQRVENVLPACKNIGTTHITNGCYRLHPTEWNIGEAAGALAAYCLDHNITPRGVRNTKPHLEAFQAILQEDLGFVLEWPEYARSIAL